MIVAYPSSFSQFRCTVSEKSSSEIFSHFPIFSKSVHPLIMNLLWEMHHDGRNIPTKFQLNPVCRLGEVAKRSSGLVKMQQQQLECANLNVETYSCILDLGRGYLHKQNNHTSDSKEIISQMIHHAATETDACSNKKHLTATI